MKRFLPFVFLVLLTGALVPGGGSLAQSWAPGQARDAVKKGDIVPLRNIFAQLARRYGGYQLGAELFSRKDGGSEYRIDWVSGDGRKLKFVVDARTGRIMRSTGG